MGTEAGAIDYYFSKSLKSYVQGKDGDLHYELLSLRRIKSCLDFHIKIFGDMFRALTSAYWIAEEFFKLRTLIILSVYC